MAVTITDIARRSGVAKSTVSRVLNRKTTAVAVSDATRRLVEQVARDLNYRPSFSARALTSGKTQTLGLVCGDLRLPFFAELVMGALLATEARGYHLLVSVTQWDPEKELRCLDTLLERRVEGLVMLTQAVQPGNPYYEHFKSERFPVIIPDCDFPDFHTLLHDWQAGMNEAVAHLKARGHRTVGFVRQEPVALPDDKHAAFLRACKKQRLAAVTYECGITLDSAKDAGRRIAGDPNRPSALIANSDYVATGVNYGLWKQGLSVPRDLALVGIDGTQMGAVYNPPLTTIDLGIATMADTMVELVLRQVADRRRAPDRIVLPTRLVVRESA
ncbi:MAG: LacI family DNA-binding transcriptional regulator [Lentisphaeria bacterium]